MYDRFSLVLTLTHACPLRCTYCYAGKKHAARLAPEHGRQAIDRAVRSLSPRGRLDLGFFGGEPLLEPRMITELAEYAQQSAGPSRSVRLSITTSGFVTTPAAWSIMMRPDLDLAISCDGLPEVHDLHRRTPAGGTSDVVFGTIRRLVDCGRKFAVVMVVRPDTVDRLADGIDYLRNLGARRIDPSLDVWSAWPADAIERLEFQVVKVADIWRSGLPVLRIGWCDEKAAQLAKLPYEGPRCGFGDGELAVAPSGRLYPCERLIGEDDPANPMVIGHVEDGQGFGPRSLGQSPADHECDQCTMLSMCNAFCRCSNWVRSGDISRPDELLCRWNQACLTETARVLNEMAVG